MRALLLALLLTGSAHAASLDAVVSAGIGKRVLEKQPFERYGALGVRYGGTTWKAQANGGYWLALAAGERASYFGSIQGGMEIVGQGGTFALLFVGPSLITQDDSKLAGHFQFHITGGIGTKNADGYGLAGTWQHWSNAGIKQPNAGRDILVIQVSIPLL